MIKHPLLLSALILSFLSLSSHGKKFDNEYVSFNLADNWACSRSGPNWICEPSQASQRKLAIITVTGKEAGSLDQISNFEAFLQKPRSHQMGSDTPVMSQVKRVNRRTINNHEWVQALHLNGEVNNFYTLYLATVKQPMAVMVTLSAEKNRWDDFHGVFEGVISSLQVKQVVLKKPAQSGRADGRGPQPIGPGGDSPFMEQNPMLLADQPPKMPMVYIAGLVAALVILASAVFIFLKK